VVDRRLGVTRGLSSAFVRLWVGQSISLLGTQVTLIALPLTAVVFLHVTPFEIGVLSALETLPYLLFSLAAGALADRLPQRPLIIAAQVALAAALATVPLLSALGVLDLRVLYGAAFAIGTLSVVLEITQVAYVPSVVDREELLRANSRLEVSASLAQVLGAGFAGILIGLATAPLALVADALSYVLAAAAIRSIRTPEASPRAAAPSMHRAMWEAFHIVLRRPLLKTIVVVTSFDNVLMAAQGTLLILFMKRDVGLAPGVIGVVFACGGAGAFVGATTVSRLERAIGAWASVLCAQLLLALAILMVAPAAQLSAAAGAGVLAASSFCFGAARTSLFVNLAALRQKVTPPDAHGRVTAVVRMTGRGAIPLGALLGGAAAAVIAVPATFVAAGLVLLVPAAIVARFAHAFRLEPLPAL
jgi:MFS family permease